jgi:hypothetical protein
MAYDPETTPPERSVAAKPVENPAEPGLENAPVSTPKENSTTVNKTTEAATALANQVDDFEADIRAALAQGALADSEQASMESGQPPQAGTSVQNTHAIFDQMGRNMQYANTFNLGTVELDRRFDAFENELDQEMTVVEPAGVMTALNTSGELDDIDVLADIVEIGEKSPVKEVKSDKKSGETADRVVLTGDGENKQETVASTGPSHQTEAKQPPENAPARLVDTDETVTEPKPIHTTEEQPSLGVRNPEDEFEASRQGILQTSSAPT